MEISEDGSDDTDVHSNSEYDVYSESREHEGIDNDEPYLKETLP